LQEYHTIEPAFDGRKEIKAVSRKGAKLPVGSDGKIIIICTEEQEKYIKEYGCIACDDDICDCAFCGHGCAYCADDIEFRRE